MDAVEALGLLRSLGLTLTAEAGRLIVQPADLLDDDLRWLIRKHRDAIFQGASVGSTPGGVAILAPLPVLSPSGLWYFTPPRDISGIAGKHTTITPQKETQND